MRKIISFMHMSLDGFVATTGGELSWVKVDQEIFSHVEKRVSQSDTALYGRVTYQMMEGYWPTAGDKPDASEHDRQHAKWYKNAHKLVLSNTIASTEHNHTTVINGNLVDKINQIKQQPGSDILLFGSPTATHALMQLNLLDGYWLFVNPVILGKGVPLFVDVPEKIKLNLLSTSSFACGVTALDYEVDRGT